MSHPLEDEPEFKRMKAEGVGTFDLDAANERLRGFAPQSVRVGSVELCCVCWKRGGHEYGCPRANAPGFFHDLSAHYGKETRMNKQEFESLCSKYEAAGVLPKGKTADMMENYDTIANPREQQVVEAADVGRVEDVLGIDHDALDEKTKARARKV